MQPLPNRSANGRVQKRKTVGNTNFPHQKAKTETQLVLPTFLVDSIQISQYPATFVGGI